MSIIGCLIGIIVFAIVFVVAMIFLIVKQHNVRSDILDSQQRDWESEEQQR